MGIGIVIKDVARRVVEARSSTRMGNLECTMAKTLATFFAVSLSKDVGIHNILLESDALIVMDAFKIQ
jgi:hypothetical protein